jgi:hypothetical protein
MKLALKVRFKYANPFDSMDKLLVLVYFVIDNPVHVETMDVVPIVVDCQHSFVDKFPDQF